LAYDYIAHIKAPVKKAGLPVRQRCAMMGGYGLNVHRFFMKHPGSRSAASSSERRAGQGRHMCLPFSFSGYISHPSQLFALLAYSQRLFLHDAKAA